MPSLITLLGSCLVAASAAVAADRPADQAGEPWWSNPPAATLPASGPKVIEYPRVAAPRSGPKVTEIAPPGRRTPAAELAPDPPGLKQRDALPAAFQEDSAPAAGTTKADGSTPPSLVSSRQSPQHPAAESATNPAPPSPRAGTSSATSASPSTVPQDSAAPLSLGSHNGKNGPGKSSPLSAMITVGGSLAIVLGLFLIVAWAMRKTAPRGSLLLPKEVFEILGRAPLGARQQVQLLRCGNKLLLVSITPGGAETLTEVTDPLEVDRLAGVCQQAHPKSATTAFRQVFQQLAPKSGAPPELDNLEPLGTRRKRYRWEKDHA